MVWHGLLAKAAGTVVTGAVGVAAYETARKLVASHRCARRVPPATTTTTDPVVVLTVLSDAAGRVRLRTNDFRFDAVGAVAIEDAVGAVAGVRAVYACPRTASVVVWYSPTCCAWASAGWCWRCWDYVGTRWAGPHSWGRRRDCWPPARRS